MSAWYTVKALLWAKQVFPGGGIYKTELNERSAPKSGDKSAIVHELDYSLVPKGDTYKDLSLGCSKSF